MAVALNARAKVRRDILARLETPRPKMHRFFAYASPSSHHLCQFYRGKSHLVRPYLRVLWHKTIHKLI